MELWTSHGWLFDFFWDFLEFEVVEGAEDYLRSLGLVIVGCWSC